MGAQGPRIRQSSRWVRAISEDVPAALPDHRRSKLGPKTGARRLAHANASQNPPSPRGVAIRGGGMPDPPLKNRESKAACTIHRSSGSPGGGYPRPPLGDPASPRGGSAAYCTCTRAQRRFLRGDAVSPLRNKTSPRFSRVFVIVRARQLKRHGRARLGPAAGLFGASAGAGDRVRNGGG
jgi:hypothetical protein